MNKREIIHAIRSSKNFHWVKTCRAHILPGHFFAVDIEWVDFPSVHLAINSDFPSVHLAINSVTRSLLEYLMENRPEDACLSLGHLGGVWDRRANRVYYDLGHFENLGLTNVALDYVHRFQERLVRIPIIKGVPLYTVDEIAKVILSTQETMDDHLNEIRSVREQNCASEAKREDDFARWLYQDQREYLKREDQRAKLKTLARNKDQDPAKTENNLDEKIQKERTDAVDKIMSLFDQIRCNVWHTQVGINKLKNYGWGTIPVDVEQTIKHANDDLQRLMKEWMKKHQKKINAIDQGKK